MSILRTKAKGFSFVGAYSINEEYDMKEKKVNKQKIASFTASFFGSYIWRRGTFDKNTVK